MTLLKIFVIVTSKYTTAYLFVNDSVGFTVHTYTVYKRNSIKLLMHTAQIVYIIDFKVKL